MNRIHILLLALVGAIVLLFSSCQKAPELTITSSPTVELNVDGSSGTITFTANRAWTVSSSDSWVTISPASGEASDKPVTITVRCNANTTYDDRTATVTIRMEDLSQTITVKQPANKGVVLPKQVFDLQSGSNTIEVEVQANVQYTVSSFVDWIKQTGTKGLTSKTLTFSIEENKTYDPREGKITIKPQEESAQEQVISVKQAQKDALNVEKTSYDMPYGGGEIEIKVDANVEFDVKPSVDWIHHIETKALSNSTVRLTVDENPTYESREGMIEITQKNGTLSHTINVKQAGRIAVSDIYLNCYAMALLVGDSKTITAEVWPKDAWDKTITWVSSDESIATVSSGIVTAISVGSVNIIATTGNVSETCSVHVQIVPDGAVNLDILTAKDDGVYYLFWANCNLGASLPEEYGDYYAWGETETKDDYSLNTYKFWISGDSRDDIQFSKYNTRELNGYIDNKTELDPEDDVAHVKLGGKWRLPNRSDLYALVNECTWSYISHNGVYGYEVKSKTEGNLNSIFLPSTGRRVGSNRLFDGETGGYLSSTLYGFPDCVYGLYFRTNYVNGQEDICRFWGWSVRPVSE